MNSAVEGESVASVSRARLRFPWVGVTLGLGLLIGECALLVRGFMASFGAGGIWRELFAAAAVYSLAAVTLDLLVQFAAPSRLRRSIMLRAAPILVAAGLLQWSFGMSSYLPLGVLPLAAAWGLSFRVRWCWPLAFGVAVWAFAPAFPRANAAEARVSADVPKTASIAVVVLDTVRRDRCSTYGHERETTPNLTALAERGVRFDRAYATSCWSIPTHASLYSGLMPSRHGAHFEYYRLSEEVPTLASILSSLGYETVGFTGNPYISPGTGFANHFSRFEEAWRPAVLKRLLALGHLWARYVSPEGDKGGAHIVERVAEWLAERDRERPFFLFVNFMEAHAPYQDVPRRFQRMFTPASADDEWIERVGNASHEAQWVGKPVAPADLPGTFDLMDGATAAADHYLGEILKLVGEETIVVVVSDHGDLVAEHGLFGHMTSLYEPLIHIPMVMAGPGLPPGETTEALVSLHDVLPTVLGLVGARTPPVDGIDLLPALRGEIDLSGRILRAEHFRTTGVTDLWSLHRSENEMRSIRARRGAAIAGFLKRIRVEDGTDLGFDLARDPDERRPFDGASTNLPAEVPRPRQRAGPGPELDPTQIEALRSLGYVR